MAEPQMYIYSGWDNTTALDDGEAAILGYYAVDDEGHDIPVPEEDDNDDLIPVIGTVSVAGDHYHWSIEDDNVGWIDGGSRNLKCEAIRAAAHAALRWLQPLIETA